MAPNWGASGTLLCCLLLLVTTQVRGRAGSGSPPRHPHPGALP